MSELVQVIGLHRYFSKRCVIKNLSFNLKKGQVLGFLGINGAGKTTTLCMLSGNLAPHAGHIKINGFDILKQPLHAKENLGYLPEIAPLYKELTVYEFLYYCAQLHRISKPFIDKAIQKTQERCGLTAVSKRLIMNLSKGYQQRIGIAHAILHNPDVIILDEPMVGLDPIQIKEIRQLIKELGQEHGVILSSHILSEVQESCTDVQIIHQGELVLKETVADLNQQMTDASVKLTTRKTVEIVNFKPIKGVTAVESLGNNQYLIHHKRDDRLIENLTEFIIAGGWGLEEITPIKRSLEDVFLTLTKK
ncbi:MAG: ABC transporter ATP-binding protein [Methylococcales bacterium]|nr:ABC transporter ATP-binding protein [Methylococcales bacterium]